MGKMKEKIKYLKIRVNSGNIIFIDLYEQEGDTLPTFSRVCYTQQEINKVLYELNEMNLKYELHYIKI